MARPRSVREVVTAFVSAAESEAEGAEELTELLRGYSAMLAHALNTTAEALGEASGLAPLARKVRVRELLRAAKESQQAAQGRAGSALSLAAATQLAGLARWQEDRVVLDVRIVLGRGLQADRTRKFVRFDAEGFEPVTIRRAKLQEASKSLRFNDLSCSLCERGLVFAWRGGKGRLLLASQTVERKERDAVLQVVIARPVKPKVIVPELNRAPLSPSWFGGAFAELNSY